MPQPAILKITEIFASIQGEGLRMGEPTIFIRLAGCNLRCHFCDTKYAWDGGSDYTAEQVLAAIKKIRHGLPVDWICLTGGEPMCQEIKTLVRKLRKSGLKVQIETNGTIYQRVGIDWFTISPKPPEYYFHAEYATRAKEVKLVVSRELTFETIQNIRKSFPERTPILLQPESHRKWSIRAGENLLAHAARERIVNIRLSIQLQKVLNFR